MTDSRIVNHPEALIGVALGIAAIAWGMARNGEFYALGPGQRTVQRPPSCVLSGFAGDTVATRPAARRNLSGRR